MKEEILRFYRLLERRHRWMTFRDLFLTWSFALTILMAIALLLDRIGALLVGTFPLASSPQPILAALGGLLLLCVAAAAVGAVAKRVPRTSLARAVDETLKTEEMFLTSLEAAASLEGGPIRERLLALTCKRLEGVDGRRILAVRPVGYRWGMAAALCVIMLLALTPALLPDRPRDRNDDTVSARENKDAARPDVIARGVPVPGPGGAHGRRPGGGDGQGLDSPSDIFGPKPDRPKVQFAPEEVTPLVGAGEFVEKEKSVYTGRDGSGKGEDYREAYRQYRRVAEEAIGREEIAPPVRDFVRAYFDRIKPE